MAIDRFLYWKDPDKAPDLPTLLMVARDYLGDAAEELTLNNNRIIAILIGEPRFPLRGLPEWAKYNQAAEQHDKRWFEIYVEGNEYIDIITRQADEFTSVVAEGFVELAKRCWGGRREE